MMLKQYNNIHTLLEIPYLQLPHPTVRQMLKQYKKNSHSSQDPVPATPTPTVRQWCFSTFRGVVMPTRRSNRRKIDEPAPETTQDAPVTPAYSKRAWTGAAEVALNVPVRGCFGALGSSSSASQDLFASAPLCPTSGR
jgi:hypothetical protein